MFKFLHYLLFAFLLQLVHSQEFLNIFEDKYVNIKGIAVNDQFLAISTDDFLMFGNINHSLYFTELGRIFSLGFFNNILEFKFVDKKAVVICSENECNYCDFSVQYRGSCVVIASFSIQSVNVQKVNKLFLLRVVHNTTTAGIYSFKLENQIFNPLGEAFDHSSSAHKFKAIYGFSHKDHTYFISQVQRSDIVMEILSNSTKPVFNNIITQICNNDESKDIISRMDLILACKDNEIHSTYLRKVVYQFEEKVTAAGYLAASEMLLLGVEKPTNYSFICKFAMKDIELKFQHTWTNCQYISYTKCKMNTSLNKYHIKGCFQLGWKNDILEKSKFPMCRKFGLQTKEIESSCEAALSSTTVGRYGWLENINPYFGEYLKLDINSSIHGIYPQSNNKDIFILQTDIIIKAVFKNILLQSIKSLTKYELFLENNKMVTPIESYDGILYVDLIKKNSIYFKSIRCYEKDCHEVLFNEKLYCSFSSCTQRYRKFRNSCHSSEETICVPIWVKARNLITMNDKQNQHNIGIVYNYTDEYYRLQITCQENGKKTKNNKACSDTNVFLRQVITSEKPTNIINEIAKSFNETMNHDVDNTLLPYILWTFGFVAGILLLLTTIFLVYRRFKLHKNNNISLQSMPKSRTIQQNIYGKYERVLSEENLINSKNITILGKLGKPGQGNSAYVCPAIYSIGSCVQKVAIKKLKKYNETEIMEETLRLSSCNHSNIVKFIGWLKIEEKICMITEFMDGGDLHTYLKDPTKPLTSSIIFSYIFQILDAMIYLSQSKILHRDLAARNCLLDKFYKIIKIADFGTSREMNENYEYISERGCKLPFRCLPPEALFQKEFTVKGDVWSFAILIWEMFEKGAVPYDGLTADDVKNFLRAKQRLSRPSHCPSKLYNVMKACWKKDPEQRPNFESLKRDIKIIFNKIPEEKLKLSIRQPHENEVKNENEE